MRAESDRTRSIRTPSGPQSPGRVREKKKKKMKKGGGTRKT